MAIEIPDVIQAMAIVDGTDSDTPRFIKQAGFKSIEAIEEDGGYLLELQDPIANLECAIYATGRSGYAPIFTTYHMDDTHIVVTPLGADDVLFPCSFTVWVGKIPPAEGGGPDVAILVPPTVNPGGGGGGPSPYNSVPEPVAFTGGVGDSVLYSRGNHVHPGMVLHAAGNVLNTGGDYILQGNYGFVSGEILGGERSVRLVLSDPLPWAERIVLYSAYSMTSPGAEFPYTYTEICDPGLTPEEQAQYVYLRNSGGFIYEVYIHIAVYRLPDVAPIVLPNN